MEPAILEAWIRERNSRPIQTLPPNFYDDTSHYLVWLKTQIESVKDDEIQSSVLEKHRSRVLTVLKDLMETRKTKFTSAILGGEAIQTEVLLPMERDMLDDMEKGLKAYKEKLNWLFEGKLPPQKTFLRMIRPVETFVGVDLNTYGPFAPEEFATVPTENAMQLIKRGYAVEIETGSPR